MGINPRWQFNALCPPHLQSQEACDRLEVVFDPVVHFLNGDRFQNKLLFLAAPVCDVPDDQGKLHIVAAQRDARHVDRVMADVHFDLADGFHGERIDKEHVVARLAKHVLHIAELLIQLLGRESFDR